MVVFTGLIYCCENVARGSTVRAVVQNHKYKLLRKGLPVQNDVSPKQKEVIQQKVFHDKYRWSANLNYYQINVAIGITSILKYNCSFLSYYCNMKYKTAHCQYYHYQKFVCSMRELHETVIFENKCGRLVLTFPIQLTLALFYMFELYDGISRVCKHVYQHSVFSQLYSIQLFRSLPYYHNLHHVKHKCSILFFSWLAYSCIIVFVY
uniref:Transmembrane domain-containing protein n=1 Tax=Spironucleus salmonicida TaxID=348837 RepID=V6LHD8_9EUKA|eukprot:EST43131.1 Transmembrane domain-containing protein [Spironucleus salmonicida]